MKDNIKQNHEDKICTKFSNKKTLVVALQPENSFRFEPLGLILMELQRSCEYATTKGVKDPSVLYSIIVTRGGLSYLPNN